MTKFVVTPIFAAVILAVSTCVVCAQTCSPCGPSGFPSYQQFCGQSYGNSCVGPNIFSDKMVRPFCHSASPCFDPCASCCGIGGGGCLGTLGALFGHHVNCAGPDSYTYTPGYGANGQGLAPSWGRSYGAGSGQGYSPSYTYRSPRDFLNPNPPSIGY